MGCGASSGGGSKEPLLSLNFTDSAKGMDSELATKVFADLKDSSGILDRLQGFKGCGEFIREAITNPSPENEEAAWAAVVPSVDILKEFYEFSVMLEKSLAALLEFLCAQLKASAEDDLSDHQALTRKLAEIFDFVLRFDDMKMTNPAIQNDFSYYRRILNRIKLSNKKDAGITVNDELANAMSLFFAYPTPMMNSLIKVTTTVTSNESNVGIDIVSTFLARLSNSCLAEAEKGGLADETSMLCLRTITGAVLLYDHVQPKGAFCKKTPINIKGAVQALKSYSGKEKTDSLINALRFNTIHLNDEDTPTPIKTLLA